ncbi:hypothetical protein JQ625_12775 [Bradyrhizobium diazoefficiens]|nr:hypothetical protein [Bradyrhizobium diazoefficiens]MBR0775708.1 hypothetical protein [Bradyrhizobium diazoefficiens]
MGAIVAEDDLYIGSLLELFNLRFGPEQREADLAAGGISEIKYLQDEFEIFKEGRKFADSARLLGLGGIYNNRLKNRWLKVLEWLCKIGSDLPDVSGDERIVTALVKNFLETRPLPCFMRAHDPNDAALGKKVIVTKEVPLPYLGRTYLVISLPLGNTLPPLGVAKKKKKPKKK